jgi:hypothetical protein
MIRMMLAATAVTVLTAASPAAAAPDRPARTELTLSYQAEAGFAAAVRLSCRPVGGGHPKGRKACATLKKVGGKPSRLRAAPEAMCTLEHAPITAEISGTWKGRTVDWSKTFGNRCDLTRTTGVLFDF